MQRGELTESFLNHSRMKLLISSWRCTCGLVLPPMRVGERFQLVAWGDSRGFSLGCSCRFLEYTTEDFSKPAQIWGFSVCQGWCVSEDLKEENATAEKKAREAEGDEKKREAGMDVTFMKRFHNELVKQRKNIMGDQDFW